MVRPSGATTCQGFGTAAKTEVQRLRRRAQYHAPAAPAARPRAPPAMNMSRLSNGGPLPVPGGSSCPAASSPRLVNQDRPRERDISQDGGTAAARQKRTTTGAGQRDAILVSY